MSSETAGRFRKKPVVIEAVKYDGMWATARDFAAGHCNTEEDGRLFVWTLEGKVIASPGDWIVKGIKGEFYPVRADIFEATYEAVEESSRKGTETEQRAAEDKLRAAVTETLTFFGAGDVQWIVEDQLDREEEPDE